MKKKQIFNYLTKIAIFSALSFVLYLFPKFPLPFFPSFLEIQFSNLPVILSGFILGPLGGCLTVLVRFVLKLPFSSTMFSGEVADLIIGISVALTSSIIYKLNKTKKGGIIALVASTAVWVVVSVISNYFINLPFYIQVIFDGNPAPLVRMLSTVIKGINEDNLYEYYILFAVIPFNLLLSVLVSIITFFSYKRLSVIFKHDFFNIKKEKVLVICDSFKGSLSSSEVGKIISEELNNKKYHAEYLAISDGGEGFLDALKQGKKDLTVKDVSTVNAIGKAKQSIYLYDETTKTAYFELASYVGIIDLDKSKLSPFEANTYGLGLVMREALAKNDIKKIILGIGGSASTDGGSGMLEALGVKFYDKNHQLITKLNNAKLATIDSINLDEFTNLIKNIEFVTLTDVTNPLLGKIGASYVFGAQKGASDTDIVKMEENMQHYANVCEKTLGKSFSSKEGTGAAGGVGFAMAAFLSSSIKSGIKTLLEELKFSEYVKKYDTIITGEGCLDSQSLSGKVISGILEYNPKNVAFVVGGSKLGSMVEGHKVYSVVPTVATLEQSLADPEKYLRMLIKEYYK